MGMIFITEGHGQDWKKHEYCVYIVDLSRKKYQQSDPSYSKSIQLKVYKDCCWIEPEMNYGKRIFLFHKNFQINTCEISIKIYCSRTNLNISHCQVGLGSGADQGVRSSGPKADQAWVSWAFSSSWVNTAPYFLKIEVYQWICYNHIFPPA